MGGCAKPPTGIFPLWLSRVGTAWLEGGHTPIRSSIRLSLTEHLLCARRLGPGLGTQAGQNRWDPAPWCLWSFGGDTHQWPSPHSLVVAWGHRGTSPRPGRKGSDCSDYDPGEEGQARWVAGTKWASLWPEDSTGCHWENEGPNQAGVRGPWRSLRRAAGEKRYWYLVVRRPGVRLKTWRGAVECEGC